VKSPDEVLKRCMHPGVFAVWSGFLIYLLASWRYVSFLRPEFGLLLVVAALISLGFMLAAIIRPHVIKMDMCAIVRSLVLLVPVLYFAAMPDTTLGNQAFRKRFTGTGAAAVSRQELTVFDPQGSGETADPMQAPGTGEGVRQETTRERTLLEVFIDPALYSGQRVIVTGMFLRDEQFRAYSGGSDTAVYRFVVNCCAADAVPLAIVLVADQAEAFANDQWVQVEGIFDVRQIQGNPVPIISNPVIKAVEAPSIPYLY